MLPRLRFFFRQALSGLYRSIGVTALAVVSIGIALGILATFGVVIANLGRVADQLGHDVEISAYLPRGIDAALAQERARTAAKWPEVEVARFMTSTQAVSALKTSLGRDALILDGLPADVLPPSIEVRLKPRSWTGEEVAGLAARLQALGDVEDVRYGQDDIERVNALLGFARAAALVVGFALCLAAVLLVSNTIRLTVYARRDEIEIMSLIGATDAFVRAPFLIEGAIQGLLGGLFAGFAMVVMQGALTAGLRRGLSYAYGPIELEIDPTATLIWLIALGIVLGLIGSMLAVGKFVKV